MRITFIVVLFSLCMVGMASYEFFVHRNTAGAFALLAVGFGVSYAHFEGSRSK